MICLAPAGIADAEALLELQKQAFTALLEKYRDYGTNPAMDTLENMQRKLQSPGRDYWFILDGSTPIGMISVKHLEDSLCVSPIGMLPEHQGKGWGRQAMALLEQQYPSCRRWTLGTILEEPGLCRFYESLGYRRTRWQESIQLGMTEVGFEKILDKGEC